MTNMKIQRVWSQTREAFTPSPAAWRGATVALLAFWALIIVSFFATGVIAHFSIGQTLGLIVLFGILAAVSAVLFAVFWFIALLRPRYRFTLLLLLLPAMLLLFGAWYIEGSLIGTAVIILGLSLFFGAGASLLAGQRSRSTIAFFAIGALAVIGFLYGVIHRAPDPNPALANYHLRGHTLALPDPGKPGRYKVATLTYGSGTDPFRPEYAKGARIVSKSVDGSKLDEQWHGISGWVRTLYWGFDPHKFPVQGRVWMPANAPGPSPLVLIVHGNHAMEDFSDPGYAYLGQLLASQGFIVASVDENFLNSSIADTINPFGMRNGAETRVRGWMLLEHLVQWRAWNKDPHNPLFGKVDMDRIALVGHSRGGEAVAVANAFNNLDHYPEDATLAFNYHFKLRAVTAIAPVDGQYWPRDRPTPMHDIDYFVIQGSMDGDLTSFMGSSQYSRASFSPNGDGFKASLYVKDANHGQFNTVWGRNDLSAEPVAWLLDERPIMNPQAQRQILKVYLSAFLQESLNGVDGYQPLFEDARNGAAWLPNDYLINNYADAGTQWLANDEEDLDPSTGSMPGVKITGDNLSIWRETWIKLKDTSIDSYTTVLAWDDRVHNHGASYTIALGNTPLATSDDSDLVFALSNAGIGTLPEHFTPKSGKDDPDAAKKPLDWHVVLTDAGGHEASLPLSHDQLLYPQIQGQTRRFAQISGFTTSEIVMRRYRFALKDFAVANPQFDTTHLQAIRFDFDITPRGAIALDDIGIAAHR